jgi:hypothetical protein
MSYIVLMFYANVVPVYWWRESGFHTKSKSILIMTSEFVQVINRSVVEQFLAISQFTNSAVFLIKYCRWRTNYQDRKIVIPLNLFKPATFCDEHKPIDYIKPCHMQWHNGCLCLVCISVELLVKLTINRIRSVIVLTLRFT